MQKRVKAEAKKLQEKALKAEAADTGSKTLLKFKAKKAVLSAIKSVEDARSKAELSPLNEDVNEKVKVFLKTPTAVNLHEIGDAIRHQDHEELNELKTNQGFISRVEKANLFYEILRKHGIMASTII